MVQSAHSTVESGLETVTHSPGQFFRRTTVESGLETVTHSPRQFFRRTTVENGLETVTVGYRSDGHFIRSSARKIVIGSSDADGNLRAFSSTYKNVNFGSRKNTADNSGPFEHAIFKLVQEGPVLSSGDRTTTGNLPAVSTHVADKERLCRSSETVSMDAEQAVWVSMDAEFFPSGMLLMEVDEQGEPRVSNACVRGAYVFSDDVSRAIVGEFAADFVAQPGEISASSQQPTASAADTGITSDGDAGNTSNDAGTRNDAGTSNEDQEEPGRLVRGAYARVKTSAADGAWGDRVDVIASSSGPLLHDALKVIRQPDFDRLIGFYEKSRRDWAAVYRRFSEFTGGLQAQFARDVSTASEISPLHYHSVPDGYETGRVCVRGSTIGTLASGYSSGQGLFVGNDGTEAHVANDASSTVYDGTIRKVPIAIRKGRTTNLPRAPQLPQDDASRNGSSAISESSPGEKPDPTLVNPILVSPSNPPSLKRPAIEKGQVVSFYNGMRFSQKVCDSRSWDQNANCVTLRMADSVENSPEESTIDEETLQSREGTTTSPNKRRRTTETLPQAAQETTAAVGSPPTVKIEEDSSVVIDVPAEFVPLGEYCGSLGHKANHSRAEVNAAYGPYYGHPRFGDVVCIRALRDLDEGEEVFCDYGYKEGEEGPEWWTEGGEKN